MRGVRGVSRFAARASAIAIVAVLVAGSGAASAVNYPQDSVVGTNPIDTTPYVMNGKVLAIAKYGDTIVVGGNFSNVRNWNSATDIARTHLFAFSESTGQVIAGFNPSLTGEVQTLAISADGQWVYVGGYFTHVNGVAQRGITKISLASATRDPNFTGYLNDGVVNDLALVGSRVYVVGTFTAVGNVPKLKIAAVDATTGATSDEIQLSVTDPRKGANAWVRKMDVSPDGTKRVLIGNFLTVGGPSRNQVAMIDLATTPDTVSTWSTPNYADTCSNSFETYMREIDFSPNGSYFVIVTTGAFGLNKMCDSAARYETVSTPNQQYSWIAFTGGDTFFSVAVTNAAVYIGGHQRWMNNAYAGDTPAAGAVDRPGIAAVDPATGSVLSWNPTRERGVGAFALLATDSRLYVGSDTNLIGGEWHPRLAALPLAGGTANPQPTPVTLPVRVHALDGTPGLNQFWFDGAHSASLGLAATANDWSTTRAVFQDAGSVYSVGSDNRLHRAGFDGASTSGDVDLYTLANYVVLPSNFGTSIDEVAYLGGRLFYTRSGSSQLKWRWFSLESGIVGSYEYTATTESVSNWEGVEAANGRLYYSTSDGRLYSVTPAANGSVSLANATLVEGQGSAARWALLDDFFFTPTAEPAPGAVPPCAVGEFWTSYFDGTAFDTLDTQRCETEAVHVDGEPPGTNVGSTDLTISWDGVFDLGAGDWTFTTITDDGVRLWVDGTLVIDDWNFQAAQQNVAIVTLNAGLHRVHMEYFQGGGPGEASLSIDGDVPIVCGPSEWRAEYFANTTLSGDPDTERCEATVPDVIFGLDAPVGTTVGVDGFSARWTATMQVAAAETYRFTTTSDDGVRLRVDGALVIDEWHAVVAPETHTVDLALTAGDHAVVLEYHDVVDHAEVQLGWVALPPPPDVAMVVPSPATLSAGELAVRNRLEAQGATVTVVDDNVVTSAIANGYDLVYVSGRVVSGTVNTKLNATLAPVVVARLWLYDDLRLTGAAVNTHYGLVSTNTLTITDPLSPLAAGLSGSVQFLAAAASVGWGVPGGAGGQAVALTPAGPGIFHYLPGSMMFGGNVAAGCRLALPLDNDAVAQLSTDGWSLFDASVAWTLSTPCDLT